MLYYNGELLDWQKGESEIEIDVRMKMNDLDNKFFGKNAPGYAIIRYPRGTPRKNESGYYEPSKPYILDHKSFDGMMVYTKHKKVKGKDGEEVYLDKYTVIKDGYRIQAHDKEFLFFVLHYSSSYRAKRIYVEDYEAQAEQANKAMSEDIDIRYTLFSKQSPVSKDRELIKKVAIILGVENAERKGFEQLKNNIYSMVSEGEKNKNRFVNYEKFDKLVNGERARRVSYIVRSAINDGTLKFNPKTYKWCFASGSEFGEELFSVKVQDLQFKEELLVEAAMNDGALKGAIFSGLGREDYESDNELREYDRKVLMNMGNRYGLTFATKDTKEEIVKKLCEHLNIVYHEPK